MVARLAPLLALVVVAACASTSDGAGAAKDEAPLAAAPGETLTVISLVGIDCQSCGTRAVAALAKLDGVRSARFDMGAAEITVAHRGDVVDDEALRAQVEATAGYPAVLGAGQGRYAPFAGFPAGTDVVEISRGGAVRFEDHLVPGKVTVFDFYAVWCGPCREVDRALKSAFESGRPLAVRKIDVVDWDSEAARVHLKDVPQLPYVVVYDAGGARLDAISGLDVARLLARIDEGSAR